MKTISTTNARKHIKALIDEIKETGEVVAIGRRDKLDVLMLKFPAQYRKSLSDITNINTYSSSFNFLETEPDTYTISDLKERYV
jgi:hypothetical protein